MAIFFFPTVFCSTQLLKMRVHSHGNKIPFGNSEISGFYSRLYNPLLVEITCKEVIT